MHSLHLVNCKDCFYGHSCRETGSKKELWYCDAWGDARHMKWTKPDGFCHRAMLKDAK